MPGRDDELFKEKKNRQLDKQVRITSDHHAGVLKQQNRNLYDKSAIRQDMQEIDEVLEVADSFEVVSQTRNAVTERNKGEWKPTEEEKTQFEQSRGAWRSIGRRSPHRNDRFEPRLRLSKHRLVVFQEMMLHSVLLIGDHGCQIYIFNTTEDILLDDGIFLGKRADKLFDIRSF